jgi:coenzyme PQQ precursor peptide PqqA
LPLDAVPRDTETLAFVRRICRPAQWRNYAMAWKKPRVTEVCLGMEINCYASAKV